jgi:hypothetical protein
MARGGKRENAGRPSTWHSGCTRNDTTPIRVPKVIAAKVNDYAHRLDAGEDLDYVVKSLEEKINVLQFELDKLKNTSDLKKGDELNNRIHLPDRKVLYKIRDKVLEKGIGKYTRQSPVVKEVSKKFQEFIKILYFSDLDSFE